jgi:glyoxylase-like metal-dependent hydrolase (beta-lactamase superfamily II)
MTSAPPVMMGMKLPDIDQWSERVLVTLGQNPSVFAGPGTNTYLVGTGRERLLIDPGGGETAYMPFLEQALVRAGCRIQEIVLTHGHPDHIGGVRQVIEHFGELEVKKLPWLVMDETHHVEITPIEDGSVVRTEGATLRALHTPGHAPDHLCFVLEEERSLFSGDNVLGVGTTVIPAESGNLGDYMNSLERLLEEEPTRIYPAHGPCIEDGTAKTREYIVHRLERDRQILDAMDRGAALPGEIVEIVYAAYPKVLHPAAAQSVISHLLRLEARAEVLRDDREESPHTSRWRRGSEGG